MVEMTLLEAFEYQMRNTRAKSREAMPAGHIHEKGGLEYLRKLKGRGYRLRDAANELGCSISTVGMYCREQGTKWSDL